MNDRGQITIEDESGLEITNKAVLRKIKSLPQFQSQIAILEEKRKERIDDLVREAEEENNRFLNIYQLTPKVETLQDFERRYQSLRPDEYIVKTVDKPAPSEASIMWAVTQEAEEKVQGYCTLRRIRLIRLSIRISFSGFHSCRFTPAYSQRRREYGFCGTVRFDPNRDPNAETSRWNSRSGDRFDPLIFAKFRAKMIGKPCIAREKRSDERS